MIIAKDIVKSYNNEQVLKGIDLEINDGEFISVMGESGSGKSTFLSILGGFLMPDGGKVFWDGVDISSFSDNQKAKFRCSSVGFVFQAFHLIPTLTVEDNILLPSFLGNKANKETYAYVAELVKILKLEAVLKKYPTQLSGGQCQRAAIVRALAYKPSVIILDEPTGALDSGMEEVVMNLLQKINSEYKTTILQVTHSEKVASYGSRIIRLKDGRILV